MVPVLWRSTRDLGGSKNWHPDLGSDGYCRPVLIQMARDAGLRQLQHQRPREDVLGKKSVATCDLKNSLITKLWESGKMVFLRERKWMSSQSNALKSNTTVNNSFQAQLLFYLMWIYFSSPIFLHLQKRQGDHLFHVKLLLCLALCAGFPLEIQFSKSREQRDLKDHVCQRQTITSLCPWWTPRAGSRLWPCEKCLQYWSFFSFHVTVRFQGMINSLY